MEVNNLRGSVFNRVITPSEKQAYKNLKEYDGGSYKINTYEKIKQILGKEVKPVKCKTKELNLSKEEIDEKINYARLLNFRHFDFNPGLFVESNSNEASFAKTVYNN